MGTSPTLDVFGKRMLVERIEGTWQTRIFSICGKAPRALASNSGCMLAWAGITP